jgi:DNA-binding transcriptional ArsR family regulator
MQSAPVDRRSRQGMLRVPFGSQSLLTTRFAARPAPLVELAATIACLQARSGDPRTRVWRRSAVRALPSTAAPLFGLITPIGEWPAFLTPIDDDIDTALERVSATPTTIVRRELRCLCPSARPLTPWIRDLARRDPEGWAILLRALREGYDALLAARWDGLVTAHASDIAFRSQVIAECGLRDCLAGLCAGSSWEGESLYVPLAQDVRVEVDQRAATLLPSAFWSRGPLIKDRHDGSRLLIYPALASSPLVAADSGTDIDPVVSLLGRTRACILRSLAQRRTTTQLADELGISAATASEHAKTLRSNGLIVTERCGKTVLHSCTPLGLKLLAGVADG